MLRFITCILSLLILASSASAAAPRKRTARKSATVTVKPHFSAEFVLLNPTVTLDSLEIDNPKGVKSVTLTRPVYDTDFENGEGQPETWNFDTQGRLTDYSIDYVDAMGGEKYTITGYDADNRPTSIIYSCMSATQDPCADPSRLWITARYDITYGPDGRPSAFTETTTDVGGRATSKVFHYDVSYIRDGKIKVTCRESPAFKFLLNPAKQEISHQLYRYGCAGPNYDRPGWIKSAYDDATYLVKDSSPENMTNVKTTKDSHGNWTTKTWTEVYDTEYSSPNGK